MTDNQVENSKTHLEGYLKVMIGIIKHKKARSLIMHTEEVQLIRSIPSHIDNLSKIICDNTVNQD